MKRTTQRAAALLLAAMVLLCGACAKAGPEFPGSTATGDAGAPSLQEFAVQYIRTDGYRDGAQFPQVYLIHSAAELREYRENDSDAFDLSSASFADACGRYDDAFFETKSLVFVLLEEGSGSNRHQVTQVQRMAGGQLEVYIKTIVPEAGTCDMAQWHVILELDRQSVPEYDSAISVYLDGRLAAGVQEGTVPPNISWAEAEFKEPPGATLMYPDGSTPLSAAGWSWFFSNGDGTEGASIADRAHPLFSNALQEPIVIQDVYAKLAFEDDPDSITVICWPDSARGRNDVSSEPVTTTGFAFDLKPGGNIYEITAQWNDDGSAYHGTAYYCFYAMAPQDHSHQSAVEPQTLEEPIIGYCGNTQTVLYIGSDRYSFMYGQSVTLTDILVNLDYDPGKLCDCLPEYTVDTEFGSGYGINLSESYARCERGQADLTDEQVRQITQIIEWAKREQPGLLQPSE